MDYKNMDLKVDQFVAYVNEDKINLIPPFQRGQAWNLKTRQKLIENVIQGRPIPAIFLYREVSGARYAYNILDGKQRLESLILFIGNHRADLKINEVGRLFFDKRHRDLANFKVQIGAKKKGLSEMSEALFRDFQEYVIPTIEITLNEDEPSGLDEMISLFVDINSYGERVKRFEIVKAMCKDPLLQSVFGLIALKQKRGKDIFYKSKKNDFTRVLQALQVVANIKSPNPRVDRMWELLVEIVLFLRTGTHRNPIEILKSFIRVSNQPGKALASTSGVENKQLRALFGFLNLAYKDQALMGTKLATNQIHFYTMATSIISAKLQDAYSEEELISRLSRVGRIIDGKLVSPKKITESVKEYRELSEKQTTHVSRRVQRQEKFLEAINGL